MGYELHELARVFPELPWDEYAPLVASIAAYGLRQPIAVWRGKIIDGRHRAAACVEAGVEARYVHLPDDTDPFDYVLDANIRRRHMDAGQRGMLAVKLSDMRTAAGRPSKSDNDCPILDPAAGPAPAAPKTRQEVADTAGVSVSTIKSASAVKANAPPEIVDAVIAGEVPLAEAASAVRAEPDGAALTEALKEKRGGSDKPLKSIAVRKRRKLTAPAGVTESNAESVMFADYTPPQGDLWTFTGMANSVDGRGYSNERILENLLWAYTDPGDLVIDPFAGGGSTIDVCRRRGRRFQCFDITPHPERGADIQHHDAGRGLPPGVDWPDVKLVYLDPPYWVQAAGMYPDAPGNLADVSEDEFHERLAGLVQAALTALPPRAMVALLLQPTHWKAPGRRVVDHPDVIRRMVETPSMRRIQCPLPTQQFLPQMVDWARDNRDFLCQTRELTLWEV